MAGEIEKKTSNQLCFSRKLALFVEISYIFTRNDRRDTKLVQMPGGNLHNTLVFTRVDKQALYTLSSKKV